MKRTEPVTGAYGNHNFVTVIPVDFQPSGSPSMTSSNAGVNVRRGDDPRLHMHREYPCPDPSHVGIPTQPWYNRPGARCSVSSIHSNDWNVRNSDRGSQTCSTNTKKHDVCVLLTNKVGLCLEVDSLLETTAQDLLDMIFQDEQEIALPPIAKEIFALWIVSPSLELQLKPKQKPYSIRKQWNDLLIKFCGPDTPTEEPTLLFKRNVFFDRKMEERISDMKILELLYEEAKCNVLDGRYVCRPEDCEILAGIQAKLELDAFDRDLHTPEYFKSRITEFLPDYACRLSWSLFGLIGPKIGAEHRVYDQFKSIPSKTTSYKLLRKYLEFCWELPFYGSAFFAAQIEKPAKGMSILLNHHDTMVQVAINREGIHLIDPREHSVLLSLKYKDFSWDYGCPPDQNNPNCFSCLFLQFRAPGGNRRDTHILQVFSKQAKLMDSLINSFVEKLKQRASWSEDEIDTAAANSPYNINDNEYHAPLTPRKVRPEALLAAKLNRLSLATFDESGECLKRSGSWAFKK